MGSDAALESINEVLHTVYPASDHLPSTEESQHQVQEIVKNVQKVDWTGGTESIGDHEGLTVREQGGRIG